MSFNHLKNGTSSDFEHTPSPEDLALIQFSSGSTGEPKGVCLTHHNLITNLAAIARGMELNQDDIFDSWLPLHHDMGLIGFHLVPLYGGINQVQINTMSFIKYPLLWLESLEKEKATVTAAPNFSQALVLERLQRQPANKYNLASVRLLYNGAEPIGVDLMERFTSKMADYGLSEQAMFPVYGLAEATLAVTFPPLGAVRKIDTLSRLALQTSQQAVTGKEGEEAMGFVSVGKPVAGTQIRIVDREDKPLQEGYIGEIQVRGENVTSGYYNNPIATENAFCGTWLGTGDLGYLRKGHLYVTGRAKDIIFVNGQNYYAHDLENIASTVPGVKLGRVVLWGSFDEVLARDKVLLFLHCRKLDITVAELFCQVQQRLSRVAGLNVDEMIPLKGKSFPKTSSGKLQRYKLGLLYEQGEFQKVIASLQPLLEEVKAKRPAKVPPRTQTEKLLHRVWCEELNLPPEAVGIEDTFTETWIELGGNSVRMAAMTTKLSQQYQITIDEDMWNEYPTIAALASYLDKRHRVTSYSPRGRGLFKG